MECSTYERSKYLIIKEKKGEYRIFHAILGNISKANKDMINLLDFLKEPRRLDNIRERIGVSAKSIENTLKRLIEKGFVIREKIDESFDNPTFFKKCTEFNHIVLRFYMTERCNLNCKYCFESKEKKRCGQDLELDTAIKGIDEFIKYCDALKEKPDEVKVYFFGGEPLLRWSLIPQLVKEVEQKVMPKFKKTRFGITTNAVLLDEEKAKFLFEKDFYVYLSLDGTKEFHDQYRVYSDNRGTFDDVERGINNLIKASNKKFMNNNVGVTSTIGPLSFNGVNQMLEYVCSKDIKNISVNKVGVCGGVTTDTYKKLHIPDKEFFESAIEWYERAESLGIHVGGMWGELRDRLIKGTLRFCNAIGREFGIGPGGLIYPCPFVFGNPAEAIAEITEGGVNYNEKNKSKWCNRFANMIIECKECELLGICSGGCAGMALFDKGSTFKPYGCDGAKFFVDYFVWRLPR